MNGVLNYLQTKGYEVNTSYYSYIDKWIDIWRGKAEWLSIETIDGSKYPMYTLNIAKRSCEDLASIITSEAFTIKASKNDNILQEDLESAKVLKNLPKAIEVMAYTGTVGTLSRVVNAEIVGEGETATLRRGAKTKIKNIILKASQIIPLTFEDGEIVNCAFVSEMTKKINGQHKKLYYMELHELIERGYQITNKYFDELGAEVQLEEGVIDTYNTLSDTPLFNILKLEKENPIRYNNGLGVALFGNAIDQLKILDLTYNNFGMDFKLGQKIIIINKKLTREEIENYEDEEGNIKQRRKIIYPTDIQKQQFVDISDGIMGTVDQSPYIFEYNPDLRVGDNKEGIQFGLDTYCFEIGFGTEFYSFDKGSVKTATEIITSRKDFTDNMNKIRKSVNEFLKGVSQSLLLCEKILGNASIDEKQDIDVAEVDGFMQDDETERIKLQQDYSLGAISLKRYLMKVYKMTEAEALKEIEERKQEDSSSSFDLQIDNINDEGSRNNNTNNDDEDIEDDEV